MSESDTDEQEESNVLYPSSGPDREEMVSGYLPGEDDWMAKTHLDVSDPAAIAALRSFDTMFPEVDDLQPLIDDFLDDFLKSKTSIKGFSREEYRKILMGMFGASDDNDSGSRFEIVAADDDD